MDVYKQQILDTITNTKVRGRTKGSDAESILKILASSSTTSITSQDVQYKIQFFISISKPIADKQRKVWIHFLLLLTSQT